MIFKGMTPLLELDPPLPALPVTVLSLSLFFSDAVKGHPPGVGGVSLVSE